MAAVRKTKAVAEPAGLEAPFLGVATSARGFTWRERLTTESRARAMAISQRHGLPELMGRVLAARGSNS